MSNTDKPFRYGSQQDRGDVAHSVGDLVNVASNDRAQRQDGKFISDHELNLIEAHADEIRDGLAERDKPGNEKVLEEVVEALDELETSDKEHDAKDAEHDREIIELREIIEVQNQQISQLSQLIQQLGGDLGEGHQPKHRAEAEEAKSDLEFKSGDKVKVQRPDGHVENGWIILETFDDPETGKKMIKISNNIPDQDGQTVNELVPEDVLAEWQSLKGPNDEAYEPKHRAQGPGKELELWKDNNDSDDATKEFFKPEIPEELSQELQLATDKYAELTAKHRNSHFGHLLRSSKFIAKIPGMKWLAERANDMTDSHLDAARLEYQEAIQKIQSTIAGQLELQGVSLKEIRGATALFGIEHESVFEAKAVAERTRISGKTNKFVDWWVHQEGWKGKAKKALIVGGAGLAVGFTAGLAIPGIASTIAGGATGGLIARHVTKRRANSLDSEGRTLAERQSEEDLERKLAYHRELGEDEFAQTSPDGLTKVTEDRTATEKAGNRRRMKSAVAVGAAGGRLGGSLADMISPKPSTPEPTPDPTNPTPQDPTPPQGPTGNEFYVDPGNGYTNELIDFAQANGHNLTPQQAWDLHQNLVNQFGSDYIDIANKAVDTYTQNGDFRLVAPGNASWDPGVSDAIQQWMTGQGLW